MRQPLVFIGRRFFTGRGGSGLPRKPDPSTEKRKILAEQDQNAQVSAGIPVASGPAVRVIFAAWLVFALILLGLGRLTTAGDREQTPQRASAVR
jgi:hypothetical protein